MRRVLAQRSTEELAALFQEWRNQPAKLRDLLDELQNRKRPRAVALRKQVEAALSGNAQAGMLGQITRQPGFPFSAPQEGRDQTEKPKIERDAGQPQVRKESPRPQQPRDESAAYSKFTLVQPLGVSGRPSPYRPELRNDLRLDIARDDALAKIYRIREMKP